jgi:hypothetical protein
MRLHGDLASINTSFDEILAKAVLDGFSALGNSVMQAIGSFLEKNYALKIQDSSDRTKDFAVALGELFGPGAKNLEAMILNHLYATIGYDVSLRSNDQQMSFEECVERAAKFYRSKVDQ